MTQTQKFTAKLAGILVVAASLSTSAFADWRHQDGTGRDFDRRENSATGVRYRDNDRVTFEGRVRSMSRERDGYRVELDRGGYAFWVPEATVRAGRFGVGVSVRLGGIFRHGAIFVDAVSYPDSGYSDPYYSGYGSRSLRGVVDRVDFRREFIVVRDDNSGRFVDVDMSRTRRRFDDLRRGDYVELSGDWVRGGLFEAYRLESLQTGRYRY